MNHPICTEKIGKKGKRGKRNHPTISIPVRSNRKSAFFSYHQVFQISAPLVPVVPLQSIATTTPIWTR